MARYIDADALIPSEVHTVVVLKEGGTEVLESVLYAEQIDYAPTVDAVEVVRCKDCKYCKTWYFDKNGNSPSAICTFWNGVTVYKNGFCSNGERREHETNRR